MRPLARALLLALFVATPAAAQTRVQVQPHTITLTGADARATLQGYARTDAGPIANPVWTWTIRTAGIIQSITVSKSAITLVPVANGSTRVVGTVGGVSDSGTITVSGISPGTGELLAQSDSFVNSLSVQLHLLSTGGVYGTAWASTVRPKLLALGVRHFRERMHNGTSAPPSTVVSRWQDLGANGVKMTAGCWPTSNTSLGSAAHCLTYANTIGTATIDAFDGWNEVDNRGVTDFATAWVTWQTTMYNAYKGSGTWASTPVFSNSLASTGSSSTLLSSKGNQSARMDFGNMHPYPGGGATPSGGTTTWFSVWKSLSDPKPVVATETGYHNCISNTACGGVGVDEVTQAKYIGRLFFEFFNRKSYRTNWYEFVDEGPGEATRENEWGLIRFSDLGEKPSYVALKNIIALLTDPGPSFTPGNLDYSLTGALGTTHHTPLGKRDGRKYLVLWQEVLSYDVSNEADIINAGDQVTITLPTPVSAFNVYRPRTGLAPIQTGIGNAITLTVPDEVVIVEIVP